MVLLRWTLILLFLFLIFFLGCSTAPRIIEIDGKKVLEHPYSSCPEGESTACATQYEWQIFYEDIVQRKHELDHVRGLVHSRWVWNGKDFCSEVLITGNTAYTVGDIICGEKGQ